MLTQPRQTNQFKSKIVISCNYNSPWIEGGDKIKEQAGAELYQAQFKLGLARHGLSS